MRGNRLLIDVSPLRTSRDFRFVFTARVVSLLGVGLATVAVPVQVYDLTRSSLQVAAVGAVLGVTMLVGILTGGVLADRWDRKRLIVVTRVLSALVFAALAVNALLPDPLVWVVYLCAALNGAAAAGQPPMMALTPAIVAREQLAAAGALLALSTQIGAVIGPSLGGVLIAGPGLGVTYGICAAVTAVSCVIFAGIRPPPATTSQARALRSLVDGAAFMWRDPVVRGVLLIDVFAMVFAMPRVLFPALADGPYGGGATTVGLLFSAFAAGALIGALLSGWISHVRRSGIVLVVVVVIFGAATGLIGFVPLPVALALLAVAGAADMISEALRRALLAAATPDDMQGRVSGVWLAQAMVGPSVGGVEAAGAARLVTPAVAIALGGAVTVAASAALGAVSAPLRRATLAGPTDGAPAEEAADHEPADHEAAEDRGSTPA